MPGFLCPGSWGPSRAGGVCVLPAMSSTGPRIAFEAGSSLAGGAGPRGFRPVLTAGYPLTTGGDLRMVGVLQRQGRGVKPW